VRLVVLGGGPAGYAAASAASSLGAEVTLIEDKGLGGSCTLTDCIPSKTLIETSNVMADVQRAERLGVQFDHGRPHVDLLRAVGHARWVAAHQSRGVRDRLEGTAARLLHGRGRIVREGLVEIESSVGLRQLAYDRLVIATGASPWEPPFARVDHRAVLTVRDILAMRELPQHLVVVGAGATGCEYAEFFQSSGVRVTLLSARDQILPGEDYDVAEIVQEEFLSRGMELQTDSRVSAVEVVDGRVEVRTPDDRVFTGSHALICMGMRPNTADLGLEALGIATDDRGAIRVDEHCGTTVRGVYAAGDVAGGLMLANTGAMQGRHAALHALGRVSAPLRLDNVPWTIFTRPEVARVGLTEEQARRRHADRRVDVTKHYLRGNPRGVIADASEGMIKLVAEPGTGVVLGGAIVGHRASEVITAVALAISAGLTVEALADTGTVTPAMSESLQRAAEKAVTRRLAELGDTDDANGDGVPDEAVRTRHALGA
jgi:dihydrolipoamide dehydrogenase